MEARSSLLESVLRLLPEAEDLELLSIVQFLTGESWTINKIIKRKQAAEILGVCEKRIDQLASEGKIKRVYFDQGSRRGSGYTLESIDLISGGQRGGQAVRGGHNEQGRTREGIEPESPSEMESEQP